MDEPLKEAKLYGFPGISLDNLLLAMQNRK
jgi:hypothetical protein